MRRTPALLRAALLAGAVAVSALAAPTFGAFTATVHNTSSTVGTSGMLLSASDGTGTQCANTSPVTPTQSIACVRTTLPSTVGNGTAATQAVTLTTKETSPAYATMQANGGCGPVKLADQALSSSPMLVRGTPSAFDATPGPLTSSGALTLDGTSQSAGFATDISQTTLGSLGPTMTVGVWFKTTAANGTLLVLGNSSSAISETSEDARLEISGGTVKFTVNATLVGTITAQTASTYNDGNWHLAVATTAGVIATTASVYVDNAAPKTGGGLGLLTGFTGYWHLGWSSASGYFNGSLSDAFFINNTNLDTAHVSSLYGSGDQATWASRLSGDSPTESWSLADTGTTTYTGGGLPGINNTDPCSLVTVSVGTASACIYPTSASPCSAPTNTLAQYAAAAAQQFTATPVSTPTVVTTSLARAAGYNATFMPGLRLYVPVTVTEALTQTSNWTTTLNWSAWTQATTA